MRRCAGCQLEISPGSLAVFTDMEGLVQSWHSWCFSCSRCGDLLTDLFYYYSQGQLYCARHLADLMKIPRCAACHQLIFDKELKLNCHQAHDTLLQELTRAEHSYWHNHHFCCCVCGVRLAGLQYVMMDNTSAACRECWDRTVGNSKLTD